MPGSAVEPSAHVYSLHYVQPPVITGRYSLIIPDFVGHRSGPSQKAHHTTDRTQLTNQNTTYSLQLEAWIPILHYDHDGILLTKVAYLLPYQTSIPFVGYDAPVVLAMVAYLQPYQPTIQIVD